MQRSSLWYVGLVLALALGCRDPKLHLTPSLDAAEPPDAMADAAVDMAPFCPSQVMCGETCCLPGEMCRPDKTCGKVCGDGRAACGSGFLAICCETGKVCKDDRCELTCGADMPCGGVCCGGGQTCLDEKCVAACGRPEKLCGVQRDLCCTDEQACLADACVDLGASCRFTEECKVQEFCDGSLRRCVPRDAAKVCEFRPPPGLFNPRIACRWAPPAGDKFPLLDDVVMTPSVANLTDDNADGKTDTEDTPDIVFVSFNRVADGCCTGKGILRIASGVCEPAADPAVPGTLKTIYTHEPYFVDNSSGVALGNLHPASMPAERAPEIVVTAKKAEGGSFDGTVALRRTKADGSAWEEMWRASYPTNQHWAEGRGAQPIIADLDADGQPEVVLGNIVLGGLDGKLIWDGLKTVGNEAGIGNNAFLGPVSIAADIDRDGKLEVIAGNTVYEHDGAHKWTYTFTSSNSSCASSDRRAPTDCDGYTAIGNFDDDDFGEVVIVRLGEVFVIDHDGQLLHKVPIPKVSCVGNESGPPTIADFDGDGKPEIGTASANYYVVVDLQCTGAVLPAGCDSEKIRWKVPNTDCSSRATGSSVFDFDGDGTAEVVYADENNFRVFRGADGVVLYDDSTHNSNTRLEMPVVVDVDNDGKSEVVVPEPNLNPGMGGIKIIDDADNNWVRTRRIWNQHAYSVTNVTEDGQIPAQPEVNWLNSRLNNFRQNVQPAGLFDAPDLIVELGPHTCDVSKTIFSVKVSNQGALAVAPGIDVLVTVDEGQGPRTLIVLKTTTRILPGQSESFSVTWQPPAGYKRTTFNAATKADDDGRGNGQYNECVEDNNGASKDYPFCLVP